MDGLLVAHADQPRAALQVLDGLGVKLIRLPVHKKRLHSLDGKKEALELLDLNVFKSLKDLKREPSHQLAMADETVLAEFEVQKDMARWREQLGSGRSKLQLGGVGQPMVAQKGFNPALPDRADFIANREVELLGVWVSDDPQVAVGLHQENLFLEGLFRFELLIEFALKDCNQVEVVVDAHHLHLRGPDHRVQVGWLFVHRHKLVRDHFDLLVEIVFGVLPVGKVESVGEKSIEMLARELLICFREGLEVVQKGERRLAPLSLHRFQKLHELTDFYHNFRIGMIENEV